MSDNKLPDDRDIWRIAAPMILSNITVPLLGMVDTAVTGHLDSPIYLGAVAIGSMVFSFLYLGLNFLRMGTTGITAQRYGARDNDGLREALGQAVIVAFGIALIFMLLQRPIGQLAMQLVGGSIAIEAHALEYFHIRIWSAPGSLANLALIGWFIGLQNARVPMLIFLTINLVNIVLDIVFVLGLGMKVDGVALASVIAEYSGLVLGTWFALQELRRRDGHWPVHRLTQWREYAAFFAVNTHLFIRTMALAFTFAFVTAQGARMGEAILAANAVLMNLQHLMSFGLDGIAHAAEALVGKAVGEKRRESLVVAVSLSLKWSLIFAAGFTLCFWVGGRYLVAVLTDLPEIRVTANRYLPWLIALPLVSVWSYLYDGVYIGATRAREMRNIMLMSTFVVFLPAWYFLQGYGNDGLWLALLLFMTSRGIGMHIGYRRKLLPAI